MSRRARERQREGIAQAKAAGKHLGRKPALSPEQAQELRALSAKGSTKAELARRFGISRQTLYRVLGMDGTDGGTGSNDTHPAGNKA